MVAGSVVFVGVFTCADGIPQHRRQIGWELASLAIAPFSTILFNCGMRPVSISGCATFQSAPSYPTRITFLGLMGGLNFSVDGGSTCKVLDLSYPINLKGTLLDV